MNAGCHYFVKGVTSLTGANDSAYLMFTTADTLKWAHAKAIISTEAEFNIKIFEGATVSSNGTPVARFNNDRNSSDTSLLMPFANPTVTSEGTLIWEAQTGTGKSSTGVNPTLGYEIIAKQNTIYLWKIKKVAANQHYIDYDFFWYEHKNIK